MAPTPQRDPVRDPVRGSTRDPIGSPAPHESTRSSTGRLYGLDIETDTTVDGLDPTTAPIVAVGLATPEGDEVFLGSESALLSRLDRRLAELAPGVLVTWNGGSFDLPFLAARAQMIGAQLGLRLWPAPTQGPSPAPGSYWPPPPHGFLGRWGAHGHLDGFRTYRADVRRTLGLSCGLKAMARLVGMEPVEVDYEQLHHLSDAELARYVASDARLACRLVQRRLPAVMASVDRAPVASHPHAPTDRGERSPVGALPAVAPA